MTLIKEPVRRCRVAVVWIDWYPYHVARFRGLLEAMPGETVGIELVGGIGVHAGLKFRETLPNELPIETLLPTGSWNDANKRSLAFALWRRLSKLRPEVVLVPGYYTLPAIAAALWARVHGAQSVLMSESTAGDHERVGWKETLKSAVIRSLFGWAVVGGKRHIAYLAGLGFSSDRVVNFYDVVDNRFFSEGTLALRERGTFNPTGLLSFGPFFLYVGRLSEEKNLFVLLASWVAYRNEGGSWPLVLVGGGPQAETLQTAAHKSPYSCDVFFPGMRASHDLLPFYAAAGCFVLPSTREPWGLVVNEAMAAGLPVLVSSHCGCVDDLVRPGSNGFTFDPNDTGALTSLMKEIASLTRQRRQEMGQASADSISSYSPSGFGNSVRMIADSTRLQTNSVSAGASR